MKIEGFNCPQCKKPFDICEVIYGSAVGRIKGVCKGCDVICFMEGYNTYLQKIEEMKQRRKKYRGAMVKKQLKGCPPPEDPDLCKVIEKEFNPTER